MKRLLAVGVVGVLAAMALTGCSGGQVSVGLGIVTDYGGTHTVSATDEKDGTIEIDSTVAFVTLDGNGKITRVHLDVAQTSAKFNTVGAITSSLTESVRTKGEKKTDYGMAAVVGNKEWFEQAADFEKWCVGKTVSDVKGLNLSEGKLSGGVDALASVSVNVSGWVDAVIKAIDNKSSVSAGSGYKTGLGIVTTYGGSHTLSATAEKDGTIEIDSTVVAVTLDKNGKIIRLNLDVAQTSANFSASGAITSDLTAAVRTKGEKKTDYGMAAVVGNKEWFEQAADFEKWCVGKTVSDVKGLSLSEAGKFDGGIDGLASVSVGVKEWIEAVEKAVANAK